MPLLQTNLEGDYFPQCFRCTSDKPGSLLLLVFSEIQPSLFTPVSSSLPVVMLLCFNSQSALDLKSDWPELLPSSVMRKREELWGRDCDACRSPRSTSSLAVTLFDAENDDLRQISHAVHVRIRHATFHLKYKGKVTLPKVRFHF